jgi:cytochrome P450
MVRFCENAADGGCEIGRNDEYLENAAAFAQDIAVSSFFIRLIPSFFKPLLAWICLMPNRRHFAKCAKHLFPFLSKRLQDIDQKRDVPSDFTTWYIQSLAEQGEERERNPEKIALRLMTLNFAAIHTSTFTATNILFDLFSAPPSAGFVEGIREEVETVLKENGGKWDKNVLAKMIKTDSAVRESLRISTFMAHGMNRLVVDPKGVTMSDGLHLPQGTRLSTPVWAIHHDDGIYEDARTYDAFRFSRAREEFLAASNERSPLRELSDGEMNGHAKSNRDLKHEDGAVNGYPKSNGTAYQEKNLDKVLESKNLATVTTSDTFLSFGHGRNACPGRFFAATEMKLLLAYIVLNYDIKPMETRPPNEFMGGSVLPPMKARFWVRRRKGC